MDCRQACAGGRIYGDIDLSPPILPIEPGWRMNMLAGGGEAAKRVLIVEDEAEVAEMVAELLGQEGFEPRRTSGEAALEDALRFHPDVVLLDLMMPGVDGMEVARRLQANVATRALPIILMTAMHDPAARAREAGAGHFLTKPFDISELIRAVQRAIA
jgi:CheY-like chemotaxis protein